MSSYKILAIDDLPETILILEHLLDHIQRDCTLHIANTGEEGLELANEVQPDLIFLDEESEDISGQAVLGALQSLEHCKDTPVIFISGQPTEETPKSTPGFSPINYLVSPFNSEQFIEVLPKQLK